MNGGHYRLVGGAVGMCVTHKDHCMKYFILLVFLPSGVLHAQGNRFQSLFQFSLAPSLSTNGIHAGGYTNYVALNVTSGYSSRNYLLEAGVISNLNERETRGLQFAGLANVTGGNLFAGLQAREIEKMKRDGVEANLSGFQVSGLTNFVLNNVFGAQISGGFNTSKGALHGVQLAGIGNGTAKYAFGMQLAGIYNMSVESMDGVQVSALLNFTRGGLFGLQTGLVNAAGFIEGVNSFQNEMPTGVQVGLVNHSKKMNGFQIGILNISKSMQGTQIGLVNIYNNGNSPQTRDGTSIGLINIGSSAYVSMYASDVFITNIEVATGTFKNHRINTDRFEIQIQNSLLYAVNPSFLVNNKSWAVGYGLKKYFFSRSTAPGYHKLNFFAFGADLLHVSPARKKLYKNLSLLARPMVSAGSRLHPKNKRYYLFVSAAYNIYSSKGAQGMETLFDKRFGETRTVQHWPGFAAGVLVQ
jgi:hypothetical protein